MQGVGKILCDLGDDERLLRILDLSFDRLRPEAREIFLDIASVCANRPKDFLVVAWTSIYDKPAGIFLDSLLSAALVTVVEGSVRIHDVLRDLGREKIRAEYKGTRVWARELLKDWEMVGCVPRYAVFYLILVLVCCIC